MGTGPEKCTFDAMRRPKRLESEAVAALDEEPKGLRGKVDEFFSSLELRHYPRNLAQCNGWF